MAFSKNFLVVVATFVGLGYLILPVLKEYRAENIRERGFLAECHQNWIATKGRPGTSPGRASMYSYCSDMYDLDLARRQ